MLHKNIWTWDTGATSHIKNSFEDVILLYESVVVFEEKVLTYVPPIVLN